MKVIMEGFTKDNIKEMVEHLYGVCIWEKLESGEIVCFPTSNGSVHILPDASQPEDSADIILDAT